jgi:hypothetical protein
VPCGRTEDETSSAGDQSLRWNALLYSMVRHDGAVDRRL